MRLEPGSQLDRYTVEAIIGEGGMGRVCRAFDTRLRRRVALKVLHIVDAADAAEAVANALREARAAAAITHPNATAVYDADEIDGVPCIVMEFVPGTSLRQIISGPPVPLSLRLRWLVDVAGALAAAHAVGIVHRDVKPENVMVRDDGLVKVLDFGVARRTIAGNRTYDTLNEPRSTPGSSSGGRLVGTPAYMPPEQIRGEPTDGRADQFAWGVLAYELLTGRLPWKTAREFLGYIAAVLTEKPDPPRSLTPEIPPQVEAAVLRALTKNPANRFPSIAAAAAELLPYTSDALTGPLPAPRPLSPRPLVEGAERLAPSPAATSQVPPPRESSPVPPPRESSPVPPARESAPTPLPRPFGDPPADLASWARPRLEDSGIRPPPERTSPPPAINRTPRPVRDPSPTPPKPHGEGTPVPPPRPSTPVPHMATGRRSLPDGYQKLHDPRFDLPLELDAHLALLPRDATCKGLFFNDLLRVAAPAASTADLCRAAQIEERRYVTFRDYPAAECLRLMPTVARAAYPRLPPGEALRRLGQAAFDSVMGTQVGRSTLGILGSDVDKILLAVPKIFKLLTNFGLVTSEKAGPHTFLLRAKDLPGFLETYGVGAIEGALRHCRAQGKIRVAIDDAGSGLCEVRLV